MKYYSISEKKNEIYQKEKYPKKGKLISVAINESIEETGLKKKNLKLIKPLNNSNSVKKDGVMLDYWFLLKYEGKILNLNLNLIKVLQTTDGFQKKEIIKYYPNFRKYVYEVISQYLTF
tara:strand:- start:100 stop:456 length:357 start_codon:yes stop_codon:yes gene_type:complete